MAAEGRQPTPAVIEALLIGGRAFSFFQAVRLLEQYTGSAPLGGVRTGAERLQLRPSEQLSFPRAGVEAVEALDGDPATQPRRFRITANLLGLYGTTSPLPAFFSEEVLHFEGENDPARAVLDVINHRLLSLLYRAWTKYRHHVRWEPGGADELSTKIFALCGLPYPATRDGLGVPAVRLLRYAGLLSQAPRSAAALRALLRDYFDGAPCRVEQCVLRWVWLEPPDQWLLGRQNGRLGSHATLGARIPDRGGKYRLVFGPLDLETFLAFLPPGPYFREAVALSRLMVKDPLAFDFELLLRWEEIPPFRLTRDVPPRLGWTTWLGHRTDRDGLVPLRAEAASQYPTNGGPDA